MTTNDIITSDDLRSAVDPALEVKSLGNFHISKILTHKGEKELLFGRENDG